MTTGRGLPVLFQNNPLLEILRAGLPEEEVVGGVRLESPGADVR